jgi:hypothetical protein
MKKPISRQRLFAATTGAAGVVSLPNKWRRPIVQSIVTPAHAASSTQTGTNPPVSITF